MNLWVNMNKFENMERYINSLYTDLYLQPPDPGHTVMMNQVIRKWVSVLAGCKSVLDIGCGTAAIAEGMFSPLGINYTGITLGEEALIAKEDNHNVLNMDMNFLEFPDNSFDLIFSRHVCEHSFSPLLSLMEWHRVCEKWLCLIVPSPEYFARAGGKGHYYVLYADQWKALIERAGFGIIWEDLSEVQEYRWMCEKRNIN